MATTIDELRNRLVTRRALPPPAARRALRQAAGATLQEVADAVGATHRSTVSRWEAGSRTPRPPMLGRYVEVLRMFAGDDRVA